jgi:CheY-like chemotaxis protein
MSVSCTIVCIASDRKLIRVLRRTLNPVQESVTFVDGVDALREWSDTPPRLLIVDLTQPETTDLQTLLDELGWRPLILALGFWEAQQDALSLLDLCQCENLIARDTGMDEAELLATTLKMMGHDIFGLDKYLAWGVQVRQLRISSYDDKRAAIEAVADFARRAGCRRSLLGRVEIVLDELLMNALYDAPASESGDRSRYLSRAVPGGGPVSSRSVSLSFACDGRFFALSVKDEYGSLKRQTILHKLNRAVAYAGTPLTHAERGSGLGLYFILNSVSRFVANIEPGRATEVICLFDLRRTGPSLQPVASSFNIFTTPAEGATPTATSPV